MKTFFVGLFLGITIIACESGGRRIDFDEFPNRNPANSVYMKCKDGDLENVCKYVCKEYKRDNTCKDDKRKVVKLDLDTALERGYVVMSKHLFIKLLRGVLQ